MIGVWSPGADLLYTSRVIFPTGVIQHLNEEFSMPRLIARDFSKMAAGLATAFALDLGAGFALEVQAVLGSDDRRADLEDLLIL